MEILQTELRQANEHIEYLTQLADQNQQVNTQRNAVVSQSQAELLQSSRSNMVNGKPTPRISFKED